MTSVYLSILYLALGHPRHATREAASLVVFRIGGVPSWAVECPDAEISSRARMLDRCPHCRGLTYCPVPGYKMSECPTCDRADAAEGRLWGTARATCRICRGLGRRR